MLGGEDNVFHLALDSPALEPEVAAWPKGVEVRGRRSDWGVFRRRCVPPFAPFASLANMDPRHSAD